MFDGNRYNHVCESVLVISFHCENAADMFVVMPPKDPIFCRLEAIENGLHGDDRKRLSLEPFCVMVSCLFMSGATVSELVCTFFRPLFPTLPDLLLRVALAKDGVLLAVHAYRDQLHVFYRSSNSSRILTSWFGFIALLLSLAAG